MHSALNATDSCALCVLQAREARRVAGDPERDGVRFVAKSRRLEEYAEAPETVANDLCDIMQESVGDTHKNTCDEWREEGAFTVETVDVAPTVMALLGLPVPSRGSHNAHRAVCTPHSQCH